MMDCIINWGEMELINIVKLLRMFGYVASLLFQPVSVAKMAVSHRPPERFLYCKDGAF